eukprot:CFRG7543T1
MSVVGPEFNASDWLGTSYPAPTEVPTDWQFADGYWWTVSCWIQEPYNNVTIMPPQGGTTADCPPGLLLTWTSPPPLKVYANQVFNAGVNLTINQSLLQLERDQLGYYIPHMAMYGCQDFDNMFCLPEVDPYKDQLKISQVVPPLRSENLQTEYIFESQLKLGSGRFMVTSNINFFDGSTGNRIILSLGCFTTAETQGLSGWVIAGITVAGIIFLFVVVALGYMFWRYKKERKMVKKLRPREYPKNMPEPMDDVGSWDSFRDQPSIPQKSFMALEKLGHGAFGEVFKGALFHNGRAALCAIKSLKEEHRVSLAEKFLSEADVMKELKHPNIVRIIGVSGVDEEERTEICILMEYLPGGDLRNYLVKNPQITLTERLWFCFQLASGCEYVAGKHLVHRDIAARNCLLGGIGKEGYPIVKISDFGLARVFDDNQPQYVMEGGGLMPIRWMAVESIIDRQFSEASDVWAYGVTVWEIFSCGKMPYYDTQSYNLAASIAGGLRLVRPEGCPENVYDVIKSCWLKNTKDRPTCTQLVTQMELLFMESQSRRITYKGDTRTLKKNIGGNTVGRLSEYLENGYCPSEDMVAVTKLGSAKLSERSRPEIDVMSDAAYDTTFNDGNNVSQSSDTYDNMAPVSVGKYDELVDYNSVLIDRKSPKHRKSSSFLVEDAASECEELNYAQFKEQERVEHVDQSSDPIAKRRASIVA